MESDSRISTLKETPVVLLAWSKMNYVLKEELGCLDNGIVMLVDKHIIGRQFTIGYCEADGSNGKFFSDWNSKVKRPGNHQVGFLNLTNDLKQKNVERFLGEESFAAVLISGGVIPDYLMEGKYLIKLEEKDNNLVRSTLFSKVIQELQFYMKENTDEICCMLQKFQTSRVMTEYSGTQEKKLFYMHIMAVGKILQMFVRQTETEEVADLFFKEYHREWTDRIASIPNLADTSDIAIRFRRTLSEYMQLHPEIQTGRIECVEADLMSAVDEGRALLYDDRFVYCPEKEFDELSAPLRITVSSAMLKKMCADSDLIRQDAEGFTPKKQYTNVYGRTVRKHFVWIYKDVLLDEADAVLWKAFGDNYMRENGCFDIYGTKQADCSTPFYVGLNNRDQVVTVSQNSVNYSVLITGISGAGKSYAIDGMERQIAQEGVTVCEIDINGNRKNVQGEFYHYIQVCKAGLSEELITGFIPAEGMDYERCSQDIVEVLRVSISALGRVLGEVQLKLLQSVVADVLRDKRSDEGILMQISRRLKDGSEEGKKVYGKLQELLSANVFRKDGEKIESGKINIISFSDMGEKARIMSIEILLALVMRTYRNTSDKIGSLSLVVDEFQHLSLKKGLSLHQILTEGRKYGLNLILATQYEAGLDSEQKALINQTAVQIYFKQAESEVRSVARKIGGRRELWETKIKALKIGQAVAVGTFSIGDKEVNGPIVIHSEYKH